MNKRNLPFSVLFALLLGCTGGTLYRPLVDTKGVDRARYAQDQEECARYASQVAGPGTQAAVGAVAGAVAGALLARLIGRDVNRGAPARVGAAAGAAGGAASGIQSEADVIRQCLRGRGYNVLN